MLVGAVPGGVLPSFSPWKKKVAARRRRNIPAEGKQPRVREAAKLPVFSVYFRKLVCYNIKNIPLAAGKERPMSKFYDKPSSDLLYQALLQVHTLEECRQFLQTCARCLS